MGWFFAAIGAFFLLAVTTVTDKFMLEKTPIVPLSFSFAISFAGALICTALYIPLLLVEKKFFIPTGFPLIAISVNGISQFFGLLCMFETVSRTEVSKANPVIVAFQPVFCFILTIILPLFFPFLNEQVPLLKILPVLKLVGSGIVVTGGYFLSTAGEKQERFDLITWFFALCAGLLFGLSSVFANISYSVFERRWVPTGASIALKDAVFLKAFVWGRWITFITAILFVLFTGNFKLFKPEKKVNKTTHVKKGLTLFVFIFGQVCGGIAIVLQQYALKLGNAVLVTALNGIQFFFVIIIIFVLTKFFPSVLQENVSKKTIFQKVLWSAVLCAGVALMVV